MLQPMHGSYNPYPLSQTRTERVCMGKADECDAVSKKDEVSGAGFVLPMQKIYRRLNVAPEEIANFCEKWRISELALFGSVLREDFRSNGNNPSDIDLLFSYLPDTNMSLLRRVRMKQELENLLGRRVDLLMTVEVMDSHNPIRRKNILESAQIVYVKG